MCPSLLLVYSILTAPDQEPLIEESSSVQVHAKEGQYRIGQDKGENAAQKHQHGVIAGLAAQLLPSWARSGPISPLNRAGANTRMAASCEEVQEGKAGGARRQVVWDVSSRVLL